MDGQNLCASSTLSERLRVFISSAQKDENGLAWRDVRQRIKSTLALCAPLSPFIIEDEASPTPSSQFYRRQVEHSDLVVLLVKGEVRPGTLAEYALATQLHKPLLAYFLEDKKTKRQVKKLKNDIETSDYCTYRHVSDFEAIEYIIWKDIMDSIVREFQDKYYTSQLENNRTVNPFISEYNSNYLSGIPSRIEMAKFNSCYNHLFEILGFNHFVKEIEDSELHDLGISLIQWLFTGQWMIKDKDINEVISEGSGIFKNTNWLKKRWRAICYSIDGDLKKAITAEKAALRMAREASESSWIINNILIDCRNMEMYMYHLQHKYMLKGEYQKALDAQDMIVCLPPLDRYLNNIYNYVDKDEFREKTLSPYTELYGSDFSNALTDIANYLFTAAIYGSYTHLLKTREICAYVLDHYSIVLNESSLAFEALKQHLLLGDTKDFKLYIDYCWDTQYAFITSNADELWKLTDFITVTSQKSMKLLAFSYLGVYLSDFEFRKADDYIYGFSNDVNPNNSELYFNAIFQNLERLNANRVIESIIPIIAEKRYSIGNGISHIIFDISIDKVSKKNLKRLATVLKEQFSYLMSVNGDPQILAVLVHQNREIFSDLVLIAENELNGFQKALYRMNLGLDMGESVLQEEIKSARSQLNRNRQEGVYVEYANNPYTMISMIIRKEPDNKEIDNIIIRDFIPLSIDVLNSEASVQVKEPCLTCLCEVLSHMNNKGEELPVALKEALLKVDINKGVDFFGSGTRKLLEIRLMMAKILVHSTDTHSLLQWCYEFGNLDIKEKVGIIDCLEKYLFPHRNHPGEIDPLLLSIVLHCSSEQNWRVRRIALKCLAYVLQSNQNETILVAINRAVYDPSAQVRMTLLNICKAGFLPSAITKDIIRALKNDANYCIRKIARQRNKGAA